MFVRAVVSSLSYSNAALMREREDNAEEVEVEVEVDEGGKDEDEDAIGTDTGICLGGAVVVVVVAVDLVVVTDVCDGGKVRDRGDGECRGGGIGNRGGVCPVPDIDGIRGDEGVNSGADARNSLRKATAVRSFVRSVLFSFPNPSDKRPAMPRLLECCNCLDLYVRSTKRDLERSWNQVLDSGRELELDEEVKLEVEDLGGAGVAVPVDVVSLTLGSGGVVVAVVVVVAVDVLFIHLFDPLWDEEDDNDDLCFCECNCVCGYLSSCKHGPPIKSYG